MIYDFEIAEELGEELGKELVKLTLFLRDRYDRIINNCFKKTK